VVKFWQKRACNYANPFMRENTRGYRRKTVNLHVELVSDEGREEMHGMLFADIFDAKVVHDQ
jgi:hypothetical protein